MFNTFTQDASHPARVLVVSGDPGPVDGIATELMRRSALVAVAASVSDAGSAVRTTVFDTVFVAARNADAETALLIQLLRGASSGTPRILLLVDPAHAGEHPLSVSAADATVSLLLPPSEIADLAVPGAPELPKPYIVPVQEAPIVRPQDQAAKVEATDEPEIMQPGGMAEPTAADPAPQSLFRAVEAIARAAEAIANRAADAQVVSAPATPTAAAPAVTMLPEPVLARAIEPPPVAPVPVYFAPAAPEPVQYAPVAPEPVHYAPIEPIYAPPAYVVPEHVAPIAPMSMEPPAAYVPPMQFPPLPAFPEVARSLPLRVDPTPDGAPAKQVKHKSLVPGQTDAATTPNDLNTNRRFYDRVEARPQTPMQRLSKVFFISGWLALAGAIIGLTTWPISTQAQFTLGLATLAVMTFIRKLRLAGVWRTIFLALGITMILRYVYWRTTTTLPPMHDVVNFTPGFLLFIAEMYCVLMFFISVFIIADPIERKPPPKMPEDRLPTVDVFIPTYNEDAGLLAATVAAATQMDYPVEKLNVYLLDDGGTDQKCNQADPEKAAEAIARRAELQSLCQEMGITYITRAKNEHAKAGNMNNALVQTDGQIIVVFDADHAPARQFLRETVGYFSQDRKLFLVQTPHFFINPDPIEKNLQTFDRMPSENEMFYGTIQKGLDKWNGAFFCGSAALLSRRALESVGGFSGLSITEDCETALDLHKRGWNSLYVDKPLIAGLQPESLVSFIGQRSRWCRGMVQILVLKNPLLAGNISFKQRIAYVSSMFYWLFPIPRMIFLFSPFLYIFLGMQIFQSNAQEFFSYVTIYMLTHMTIQNYIHGTTRWPWVSEAYEYVQTIYLVKGIWGVLLNPRRPTFNVTAKGLTLDNDHLSELAWPYFAMFGLILLSLVVASWRMITNAEMDELLLIVGGWSLYNLIIAGVALGIVAERRERRKTPRMTIKRRGELLFDNGEVHPVNVIDSSIGGMRIVPVNGKLPTGASRGYACHIRIIPERPDFETLPIPCTIHSVTNDGRGASYGLKFENLRPIHFRGIADAMYADMTVFETFRSGRRAIKGLTMGTLQFLWWSAYHTFRAFYYAIALRKPEKAADTGEQLPVTEAKAGHPQNHTPAEPIAELQTAIPAARVAVRAS